MDLHKSIMEHPTEQVIQFLTSIGKESYLVKYMVYQFYFSVEQLNNSMYSYWLPVLETFYTILCSFYKIKFFPTNFPLNRDKLDEQLSIYLLEQINVDKIQELLYSQSDDKQLPRYLKLKSIVLNILVLHMYLSCDKTMIWTQLENLQALIHQHLVEENDVKLLDVQLMNCYVDSLLLHQRDSKSTDKLRGEVISKLYLQNVQLWLSMESYMGLELLTEILPKLIILIDGVEILQKVWEVLVSQSHPCKIPFLLEQTADVWFPIQSDYDKQLMVQIMDEQFWLLLLKLLSSQFLNKREAALYLLKKAVDFASKHGTQDYKLSNHKEIEPLVCFANDSEQDLFKKDRHTFFVILEALKEQETHLITPIFPPLMTLANNSLDNHTPRKGLHIAWIRCVFSQIIQHDNDDVVKWGLLNVFTLDLELYNDEFLSTVLNVLNNPYLYENDGNEGEPTVVEELIRLLNNAETKNSSLVTRFIAKASEITWGSVALFYLIHALSMVKQVYSIWTEVELDAVKSLVMKIKSSEQCQTLRIGSEIELLETVTHFATESLDLIAVASTLVEFSTSEALVRSQIAWVQISAWLSKSVNHDEAIGFLDKICALLKQENSHECLSSKSFALIIMLLHDAQLILNSKSCDGFTILRTLLPCLIDASTKSYTNAELRTRSIKLICYLMEFTSSKDCILREFLSNYASASLGFTFRNLRKLCDLAHINNIDTYVTIAEQFLTPQSSTMSNTEIVNHTERFEGESWSIIEDGEDSNNVQRFFGIKILYVCLKAMNMKLKNYRFIGPLYKTYKIPMTQSFGGNTEENQTCTENKNLEKKVAEEYYHYVAELFYEYVKDESVDEWLPDINWIEQVLYLMQVGGNEVFVPLVGILSQIFHKDAVKDTDMDNFKTITRQCWKSIIKSSTCLLAAEEMMNLMFSSPFLECEKTRELTVECTHEIVNEENKIPELRIILLEGLKQAEGEYLSNFYEAIVACLLHRTVLDRGQKIELQARSYVCDHYQEVCQNHLSNMIVDYNATTRAHAVTLIHKMITDNPIHAGKLLHLIIAKLDDGQGKTDFGDLQICLKNRIMQVLLVLQPILENEDMGTLYSMMCHKLLTENNEAGFTMMQEWILIRIYLENETLRNQLWDLFDQARRKRVVSLCSVVSVVYHVARCLSSTSQLDFIDRAFQYIMPCCMVHEFNVSSYVQVVAFKLYNLATEMAYSNVTKKYKEFYAAVINNWKHENASVVKLQNDFYFTVFNPIEDYSLETLFYKLPRLSNVHSNEYIPLHMFEKFGFKVSNSHPLKLSGLKNNINESQISPGVPESCGDANGIRDDINSNMNCSNNAQQKFYMQKTPKL